MLKFLSIQNIVLIDSTEIEFSDQGLHIFSGETGSGKSLLLNAIGLAMGKRSSSRLIGDENDKALISACFDISKSPNIQKILIEQEIINKESPNLIYIRRIIQKNAQNRVFINDQLVSSSLHQKIGESLIEIHGQHDTAGLLNQSNHRLILDSFAKNEELLSSLSNVYYQIKDCEATLNDIKIKKNQYIREKDYLEFVINELEEISIKHNEEHDLIEIKNKIKNHEMVNDKIQNLINICNQISNDTFNANSHLIKTIDIFNRSDIETTELDEVSSNLDQISQIIENNIEIFNSVSSKSDSNEFHLDEIEERLFKIKNITRKFNVSSNDLDRILTESKEKLETIVNQDEVSNNIVEKINNLKYQYNKIAKQISSKRENCATKLSKKVEEELRFLKMDSVKFEVKISDFNNDEINEHGLQKISFIASINNKKFDEINKIASGGELSRFMLALKISLMETKTVPTIIFDEIDTGISGVTADAVGNRLSKLGDIQQVLVVTHQPQIAAKSSNHFCIKKTKEKNKIKTTVEKLENNCKFKEVARMISGKSITQESLAAAKKLFNA